MKKKMPVRKKILIVLACVLVLLIAGVWILTEVECNLFFGRRYETDKLTRQRVEFYDGLERTQYIFPSDKGQKLTGYLYSSGTDQKGIIIFAHGYGGGQSYYMNCADYFAKHGYYVFAFDATGSEESEGESTRGLPQGMIDLSYAISFVEESGNFPQLPIALFGHSWGGYCVSAVLTLHPEVEAVVACSGYNDSLGIFISEGKAIAGPAVYLTLPFLRLHDYIKFGKYSTITAEDGFNNTDARIMIVHSTDDKVVPAEIGYNIYYRNHKDDPRFSFICYEDKGHRYFHEVTPYVKETDEAYQQWLETLDYDYNDKANAERLEKDREKYYQVNVDVKKYWENRLNRELMDKLLEFYDSSLSNKINTEN